MESLRALQDNLSIRLGVSDFFSVFLNIADVLIVAFVLYRLITLIRDTRAVQLLKGLGVLLAATYLSSLLNLNTVHWLLKQTLTVLVVALPIVFQPELRRALEKIGGVDFFTRPLTQTSDEDEGNGLVNEVVLAVEGMSAANTGALIVLERGVGLREVIETGVKVDGLVSAELLTNIFIDRSPLHDGAVIIRGNKLIAAACVLPLSESKDLGRELGTRHRAALGLAEQSDALVVVVSEETGGVSLALEGVLYPSLDSEGLKELMTESLSSSWRRR